MHLGPHGGFVKMTEQSEALSAQGSTAVVTGEPMLEVQGYFLTFDVDTVDLDSGRVVSSFHYEPDYDTNRAGGERIIPPGTLSGGRLHVEGNDIYALIGIRIYRYRLADPKSQHPLLVSENDKFVGGPYAGAIYVERQGGVWTLRPRKSDIQARLIAPSTAHVEQFAISGRTAYVGFEDGELRGVDVHDGHTVLDAKTCPAKEIGAAGRRVYIVCAEPKHRVVAFPRPDSP